ncbi:aminoacyl-tRNA hydrolase [bacterium]|nr:aminoacyl-tRNA hydrolase [bacterium]
MAADSQLDLVVSPRLTISSGEWDWNFTRGSGPGGQNVNKVNSKAILRWRPVTSPALSEGVRQRFLSRYSSRLTNEGELIIESEEFRDQPQNIRRCLEKLREMLQPVLTPPKIRRPTKPTKGSQRRRLQDKQRRSDTKQGRKSPPVD